MTLLEIDDELAVYSFMDDQFDEAPHKDSINVLIDYSSMPRLWYAAIINWFIMHDFMHVRIDCAYSIGRYTQQWASKEWNAIVNVAGCGSVTSLLSDKVLIVGLGFDGMAPFSVYNWVEPDEVISYIANPAAEEGVVQRVEKENEDFLVEYCNGSFHSFPLRSVERAFQILGDCVSVLHDETSVVLAPLGPKPHILASILLCQKYSNTACLMMRHEHNRKYETEATGEIVLTRVELKQEGVRVEPLLEPGFINHPKSE